MYNNATVDRDLWVVGNMYLNTGTLFGSKIDIDNATITMSLTVPQMNTTYATIRNSVTAPQLNTDYATVNTSISSRLFDCSKTINASCINCSDMLQCDYITV